MSRTATSSDVKAYSVTATGETPKRVTGEARGVRMVLDAPEASGGDDEGLLPVEAVLGALAGCLNSVGHHVATQRGLDVERIDATVEADLDVRRFRDGTDEERAGFRSVRATVTVETDASDEEVTAWLEDVRERNPVIDNLVAPTPVELAVEVKRD
jgi:uncharacterized OsmC-like protein